MKYRSTNLLFWSYDPIPQYFPKIWVSKERNTVYENRRILIFSVRQQHMKQAIGKVCCNNTKFAWTGSLNEYLTWELRQCFKYERINWFGPGPTRACWKIISAKLYTSPLTPRGKICSKNNAKIVWKKHISNTQRRYNYIHTRDLQSQKYITYES